MADDPYAVLGLDRRATATDIRRAYFRLAHRYHPDHNRDDPDCIAQFKKVQQAFEKLSSLNAGRRPRRSPRMVVRDCAESTSWRWTAVAAATLLLGVAVKWTVLAWDAGEQVALVQGPAIDTAALPDGTQVGSTTAPAVDPPPAEQPHNAVSSQRGAVEQVGPSLPAPDDEPRDTRGTKPAPASVQLAPAQRDAKVDLRALVPWNLSITPAELPKLDYHLVEPLAKGMTAVEHVLPVVNALELAAADYVLAAPKSSRASLHVPWSAEGVAGQSIKLAADVAPIKSTAQAGWLPKNVVSTPQSPPAIASGEASQSLRLAPLDRRSAQAPPASRLPPLPQDAGVFRSPPVPLSLQATPRAGAGAIGPLPRDFQGSPLETVNPLMLEMSRPRFSARPAPLVSWPSEPRGWVPPDGEVRELAPPSRLSPIVVPPRVDLALSRPFSPMLPTIRTPLADPLLKPPGIRPPPREGKAREPARYESSFGVPADHNRHDSWRPSIMTKAIGDLPGAWDD